MTSTEPCERVQTCQGDQLSVRLRNTDLQSSMRGVGGRSSHGLAEVRAFAGAAPLLEVERCLN